MDEFPGNAHNAAEMDSGALNGTPHGAREAVISLPTASPALPGWDASKESRSPAAPLPEELRPRNRLLAAGPESLSSAELLAVLFAAFPGTGDAAALEAR